MSTILVTRAEPGASATARRLEKAGRTAVVAPLLHIVTLRDADVDLAGVQAVLLTSANGARALARIAGKIDLPPALCAGEASAHAAREVGFSDVRSAGGDASDLIALAKMALDPDDGAVLWAGGEDAARDVAEAMRAGGFDARRAVVYRAELAGTLPEAAAEALRAERLDAVLFHSARAAEAFAALTEKAGLDDEARALTAVCISPRVTASVLPFGYSRTEAAARPHESALMDALNLVLDTR